MTQAVLPAAHGGSGARVRWVVGQAALLVSAVLGYFLIRGFTQARPGIAVEHAHHLIAFEQWLGLARERQLQELVVPQGNPTHGALSTFFDSVYIYGHWPVIALSLLWLGLRAPAVLARTRDAMLASGAVGLVCFTMFPVAPPRLAGIGMVDTVSEDSPAYRLLQPHSLTNQYAAFPSLHMGWDLLIGLALFTATRRWWLRALAVLAPLLMCAAVVVTANHYLLDVLAGATIAALAWAVAARRRGAVHHPAPRRRAPQPVRRWSPKPLPAAAAQQAAWTSSQLTANSCIAASPQQSASVHSTVSSPCRTSVP
jgi:membrane-associated phospholipid phosphatase